MCVYVCECVYVSECVCVCTGVIVCVCVSECVCVCVHVQCTLGRHQLSVTVLCEYCVCVCLCVYVYQGDTSTYLALCEFVAIFIAD